LAAYGHLVKTLVLQDEFAGSRGNCPQVGPIWLRRLEKHFFQREFSPILVEFLIDKD